MRVEKSLQHGFGMKERSEETGLSFVQNLVYRATYHRDEQLSQGEIGAASLGKRGMVPRLRGAKSNPRDGLEGRRRAKDGAPFDSENRELLADRIFECGRIYHSAKGICRIKTVWTAGL